MGKRAIFHEAIDALPEERLDEAAAALGALLEDGLVKSLLTAPYDDEELTPKEIAALAEYHAHPERATWVSDADVQRMLDEICGNSIGTTKRSTTS